MNTDLVTAHVLGTRLSRSGIESVCRQSDWLVIVGCLHHSGYLEPFMATQEDRRARELADGFEGCFTVGDPVEAMASMYWDWSHVRDSSERAHGRIAMYLRTLFRETVSRREIGRRNSNARLARTHGPYGVWWWCCEVCGVKATRDDRLCDTHRGSV